MSEQTVLTIPLSKLVAFRGVNGKGQPRTHFDPKALEELAQSMRTAGFIDPILVRPAEDGLYEIIGGHRRTKAAALAGLPEVRAVVQDLSDAEALLIVVLDNLNREAYQPWEEGSGYADLLDSGLSLADVAGRAGKSTGFVKARVALHTSLGRTARELYLRKELTLAALDLLAALPDRILSPVTCPACKVVCPEGTEACVACGKDFSGVFRCQVGNPQEVASRACIGRVNGAVADAIERIRESYGLASRPVQTSMCGFEDQLISEGALQVRTTLERKLSDVADAGAYFLKHEAALQEYTPEQRRAIAAQCRAAIKWLETIEAAAEPAPLALAL